MSADRPTASSIGTDIIWLRGPRKVPSSPAQPPSLTQPRAVTFTAVALALTDVDDDELFWVVAPAFFFRPQSSLLLFSSNFFIADEELACLRSHFSFPYLQQKVQFRTTNSSNSQASRSLSFRAKGYRISQLLSPSRFSFPSRIPLTNGACQTEVALLLLFQEAKGHNYSRQ